MMPISQTDSLLYQSISLCMLLSELHHKKFLESSFYKENCFKNGNAVFKEILSLSGGIGNPATLQTMLYLLLVCPRESLNDIEKNKLDSTINAFCNNLDSSSYSSSYHQDISTINFSRHLRNAVAHSLCEFPSCGEMIFKDHDPKNPKECFEIKINSNNIEKLLELIQKQIVEFLNERYHPKK